MNGKMPVLFGEQVRYIVGGPFRKAPAANAMTGERWIRIKLAAEIDAPHEVSVPCVDYSTPKVEDMCEGLAKAIYGLTHGWNVYAGCMGGIGRTGVFFACLAKVTGVLNPVNYVRGTYLEHAVETEAQKEYVRQFPTGKLEDLHRAAEAFLWVPEADAAMLVFQRTVDCFKDHEERARLLEGYPAR